MDLSSLAELGKAAGVTGVAIGAIVLVASRFIEGASSLRGRPYFFMMRLRNFSAAALSRFAVTTASKTSPSWSTARQR